MKAHIVGGGFGGLAAAAYLVRDAGMSGQDITVYEADDRLGGAFSLAGDAATGYILPTGAVFDAEFRCTFDLLATIPSVGDPAISVKDDFFAFNQRYPYHDRAHIIDRDGRIMHGPHFGLSVRDRLDLVRLALTPEAMLDGRRIDEFFRADFFATEFWLLWTTTMGPLPQHSAMEMRRYMNRFLPLLPDLSVMSHVLRTRFDQYRGHHRTYGGVAAPAWCDLPDGHVRPRHRLRVIVRQRHGQPARLRTRRRGNVGRPRARGYRAGDPRLPGRRSFGGIDDGGATAATQWTILGAMAAPCAGPYGFRPSRRVLRYGPYARQAVGYLHGHHDRD